VKRLFFLISLAFVAFRDALSGRSLATNAVVMPFQSNNGTGSYIPDAAIAIENAVVAIGSTDRNCAAVASQATVPLGVILHDIVSSNDVGVVSKTVAYFGLFKESLQCVATAAIAAGANVVADPANPGQVIQLPAAAGTYFIIGRARYAVINAGDPCSLLHCLPYSLTH